MVEIHCPCNAGYSQSTPESRIAMTVPVPSKSLHAELLSFQADDAEHVVSASRAFELLISWKTSLVLREHFPTSSKVLGAYFLNPSIRAKITIPPRTKVTTISSGKKAATQVRISSKIDGIYDSLRRLIRDFRLTRH